jgi:hypothetical protein
MIKIKDFIQEKARAVNQDWEWEIQVKEGRLVNMLCSAPEAQNSSMLAKIFNSKKVRVSFRNQNSKGFYFGW